MEESINIPIDRIAVLIGTHGATKKKIESKTKTTITIDSGEGEVSIEGEGENFVKAMDIVKAIARGFSPQRALTLLKEDYLLKIISVPEYTGKNSSAQKAKRGRVIGRNGETRREIEQKTGSLVSVQGKTIAIIAKTNEIDSVENVIELLLQGATHETMENFLERRGKTRFEL